MAMTVKKLRKILKEYPQDFKVEVCGGEGANGGFAFLYVFNPKTEYYYEGDPIMDHDDSDD